MSIPYNVHAMRNPNEKGTPPKFYARAISLSQETLQTMAVEMSADCTINEEDCLVVLDGIRNQIIAGLKAGKIVRIDGFGTFRPTIISNGKKCPLASEYVADKSSFNPTTAIAGAKIIFTPAKELKAAIRAASAEKYVPVQENPSIAKLFNTATEEETTPDEEP